MEDNTFAVLTALKNPYVTILGHPDDGKFPLDYEAVVKAAKDNHRMIELNNTSLTPGGSRIHAYENDRIILPLCASYKVPVIMNSDAHFTTSVGDHARAERRLDVWTHNKTIQKAVESFRIPPEMKQQLRELRIRS